ncbi:hypothetical protein GCM10010387_51530 [Streptomyces inusitatus]|uniref:Uncharacterized protein n=1 Tax=Streptomyces inusitatus TaxID=68221 RepID=A0A918QHS1_9ACTN|nr:hypothetical protein [Streptomyces inusitatus]GGZ50876.1 hypothetical protein GCM10010387_51530 [Streptomyces inusitatus]
MDSERAGRIVSALRAREVMAHLVEAGVYEFGVRVVLDEGIEALWDVDGAAGLDAEIVSDGVLIGFVPHVPGSESFTEQQLVDVIATTVYSAEGLRPPADGTVGAPAGEAVTPGAAPGAAAPDRPRGEGGPPPVARYQRRAHWVRRGRR